MDYEREDKIALKRALLALRVCPQCRGKLQPTREGEGVWVWACDPCDASWFVPAEKETA